MGSDIYFYAVISFITRIVLTGIVIFAEGYVLYWLKFDSFWRGLGKSAVLNILSASLTIIVSNFVVENRIFDINSIFSNVGQFPVLILQQKLFWGFLYLVPWSFVWVIIEGLGLSYMSQHKPFIVIWRAAIGMNLVSLGILSIIYLSAFLLAINYF
jgi:hypothetical protein